MPDEPPNGQVAELCALLIARVGEPEGLFSLAYDGHSVVGIEDGDDELPSRVLCSPVTPEAVDEAEAALGFLLPPLLRAVYTWVGNGGLCLRLLGLPGGHVGGDDLFSGMSAVEVYRELAAWQRDGKVPYLPPRLLPINVDLGCGMVDYVDCRTPEGRVWRSDGGTLTERLPALLPHLREAIEGYRALVRRSS